MLFLDYRWGSNSRDSNTTQKQRTNLTTSTKYASEKCPKFVPNININQYENDKNYEIMDIWIWKETINC